MGRAGVTTLLLDTHVLQWWTGEPDRISAAAGLAISAADELAVASITWFELAWLATHGRIEVNVPVETWLVRLGSAVRTAGITPAIATAAVALPATFPSDPADRIIVATAFEHGWRLITKDARIRDHASSASVTIW